MPLTLEQLEARKTQLQAIYYGGLREVEHENGVKTVYNSPAEIQAAIVSIDEEIAALNGVASPRFIRTSLGTGY